MIFRFKKQKRMATLNSEKKFLHLTLSTLAILFITAGITGVNVLIPITQVIA